MHEYIGATEADPGASEPSRDGYGWNSFLANLLESAGALAPGGLDPTRP